MRLFDTHCHFDFAPFSDDFPAQLQRAKRAGVERFMIPAIGPSNWQQLIALSSSHPSLYISLGMHPYFLTESSQQHLPELHTLFETRLERCKAIGECGLDAMVDVDEEIQRQVFIAQIELAKTLKLPLILHARKTHNLVLQLLKRHKFPYGGVLHGFSGSYQQAMQFVELGFYIGIGGVITYPRARKTRQAVMNLPMECIVLETDAPDMPLYGHQGKPNHPEMLAQTLSCLAKLKDINEQTIAENVWKNSNSAFGICE
ncbi:deoxyribonuclease [Vibrio coralliilyticus]|uniref:TatD family hydrolase n=1 Tax=Vibrio coralliilyticus TaxID=190893 RepID=UPI00081099AD|nr:TatD family hydrolase [Vibrio coralliilyticus]ANW24888.1 deoxyribonuclease [Vibrio coralliilyticus]